MRDKFVFLPSTDDMLNGMKPMTRFELSQRDVLVARVAEVLTSSKRGAKAAADGATGAMQRDIGAAGDKHAVLWKYEKAHLEGGESWRNTADALKRLSDIRGRRLVMVNEFAAHADTIGGTAQIEGVLDWKNGAPILVKLGTVFIGDARFVKLHPQPGGLRNPVYVLGRIVDGRLKQDELHTKAHFVKVPNSDTFVRRFVTRGLNFNDVLAIEQRRSLGAPVRVATAERGDLPTAKSSRHAGVSVGDALDEPAQILSHTRGWQKRYVSTGVSNRPAYSTRGTQFMSLYGTAVVDLARLDLATVWDIHSPAAVQQVMGWSADRVVTAAAPGNGTKTFTGEEFLALRDVLRTRELLIKFQVPLVAVLCNPVGRVIVGLGTRQKGQPETVLTALKSSAYAASVQLHDALPYRDTATGNFWLFVQCATAEQATALHNGFTHPLVTGRTRLIRYVMPDRVDGWKA